MRVDGGKEVYLCIDRPVAQEVTPLFLHLLSTSKLVSNTKLATEHSHKSVILANNSQISSMSPVGLHVDLVYTNVAMFVT